MSDPLDVDRSPRLDWTADGAPRSGRFGDVYFSREDGLAETRAVFLDGCGLPDAWAGRRRFTVAELGFGTGLNIAALIDLWARAGPAAGRLHVFSVEGFPLTAAEAARALAAWPELSEVVADLIRVWPAPTPGFHRMDLPERRVVIDLAIGEVEPALEAWAGRADAWFLDGFAPSANPGMWSDAVLDRVAARSAPGARLATFTVAGAVRRGLSSRGFSVEKRPGHGRKRERLEARFTGPGHNEEPTPRVAVIGAGVAGAMLARAFTRLGVPVQVVEAAEPGAGASGFPSALVTPRLDAGDAGIAALNAQALDRAGEVYGAIDGAVLARGVWQREQTDRDARRFTRVAEQPWWPDGDMTPVDPADGGGLMMKGALAIQPARALAAALEGAGTVRGQAASLVREGDVWIVRDAGGTVLVEAEAVVLAAGWGTAALAPSLPLAPVQGQADWVDGVTASPTAWGGYATPTPDGLLYGATHVRGETATTADDAASARNLETLAARLPDLARQVAGAVPKGRRAAVRAVTPDRMPLAGPVPGAPGLHVLGGLGSRGFCHAPLLAEHVAARIVGAPSPLPTHLAARVDPARHAAKGSPNDDTTGRVAQPAAGVDG